jgi:hypothetical protein
MKVIALRTGYYDDERKRVGDVFTIGSLKECSARWMRIVDDDTPERVTMPQQALDGASADRLGRPVGRRTSKPDELGILLSDADPWDTTRE